MKNLKKGLIAWYPLTHDLKDYTGNGQEGTFHGTMRYTMNPLRRSVELRTPSDYIEIPNNDNFNLRKGDIKTISFWMKSEQSLSTKKPIFTTRGNTSSTTAPGYVIGIGDNLFVARFQDGTYSSEVFCTVAQDIGEWFLVTLVFDYASTDYPRVRFYKNAEYLRENSTSTLLNKDIVSDQNATFNLWPNWGGAYNLHLYDFRVYNRELSPSEIVDLYKDGFGESQGIVKPINQAPDITDDKLELAILNKFSNCQDYSNNNHSVTLYNQPTIRKDGSAYFSGGSYLQTVSSYTLFPDQDNWTIKLVFSKENIPQQQRLVDVFYDSGSTAILIQVTSGGRFVVGYRDSSGTYKEKEILYSTEDERFYHFVLTYENQTFKAYLDGELVEEWEDSITRIQTGARGTTFGAYVGGSYYFKGILKDVEIYSEAKNSDWVKSQYAKSIPDDDLTFQLRGLKDISRYATNNGSWVVENMEVLGDALRFNGTNSRIRLSPSYTSETHLQPANGLIIAVVKPEYSGTTGVRDIYLGSNAGTFNRHPVFMLYENASNFFEVWGMVTDSTAYQQIKANDATSKRLYENIWYHIAFRFTEDTLELYKNGELIKTDTRTVKGGTTNSDIKQIGALSPPTYPEAFKGLIKDLRIYKDPKDAEFIYKDYLKWRNKL